VEIQTLSLSKGEKDYFTFGRMQGGVDFLLEHPTISRLHAVMQFRKSDGSLHLRDMQSTHGTTVNKQKVPPNEWVQLNVCDQIQFGQSTRTYIVNGPEDMMPPEVSLVCVCICVCISSCAPRLVELMARALSCLCICVPFVYVAVAVAA
jgi:hypothetical protein